MSSQTTVTFYGQGRVTETKNLKDAYFLIWNELGDSSPSIKKIEVEIPQSVMPDGYGRTTLQFSQIQSVSLRYQNGYEILDISTGTDSLRCAHELPETPQPQD